MFLKQVNEIVSAFLRLQGTPILLENFRNFYIGNVIQNILYGLKFHCLGR